MNTVIVASAIMGSFTGVGLVLNFAANTYRDKQKKKAIEDQPTSYYDRRIKLIKEVEDQRTAAQKYHDRIDAAFREAKQCGELEVFETTYNDIDSDRYGSKKRKTRLTRIVPVMTKELAEMIREYEVRQEYEIDDDGRVHIFMEARQIVWRVLEVPAKFEPPDLKDEDRIKYPDLSTQFYSLPQDLVLAARDLLGYDNAYISEEAERRQAAQDFDVTEN
jgi:hypothetical protein